jgi:hypothetical protein
MLVNQLSAYKADIVAFQEIRWTGSGILEKQDCTLFYIVVTTKIIYCVLGFYLLK